LTFDLLTMTKTCVIHSTWSLETITQIHIKCIRPSESYPKDTKKANISSQREIRKFCYISIVLSYMDSESEFTC